MAEPHVVSALKAKRAELAGEIELATRRLQGLRAALRSLDETLCLSDPAILLRRSSPRYGGPRPLGEAGEMSRAVRDNSSAGRPAHEHARSRDRLHERPRHGRRRLPDGATPEQADRLLPQGQAATSSS